MPDPIFSYYFPEANRRAEVFRAFFNDVVRAHIRFGHVYAAMMDEKIVAAAVWRPPDAGQSTARDLRRQTLTENRVRGSTQKLRSPYSKASLGSNPGIPPSRIGTFSSPVLSLRCKVVALDLACLPRHWRTPTGRERHAIWKRPFQEPTTSIVGLAS
ncbi:hypothetical protein LP421_05325 [Rhizobium sp. RCAM05350]|nr:hypothetical protein LP421_05325 [Rhizobium sp. RCAM05350]